LREVVKSTFVDQTNTLNYRIERSLRYNTRSQWVADSVFLVSKSNTNVILTKDNTKRVKLVFPVKEGKTWPGDAFNGNGIYDPKWNVINQEPYTYHNVHESFTFNKKPFVYNNSSLQFDSTVTVIQGETESIHSIDDRKEIYAAGVGLIYRLFNRAVLEECYTIGCEFEKRYIINGNERHEVLIDHGKL